MSETLEMEQAIECLLYISVKERAKTQHTKCLLQLTTQIEAAVGNKKKMQTVLVLVKYLHRYFDDFIMVCKRIPLWKETFESLLTKLCNIAGQLDTMMKRHVEPTNRGLYKYVYSQIRDLEYLVELAKNN